jgi:outer membrane usher protein
VAANRLARTAVVRTAILDAAILGIMLVGGIASAEEPAAPPSDDAPDTAIVQAENPLGRAIEIVLPITIGPRIATDIATEIAADGEISMVADVLATALAPRLSEAGAAGIRSAADAGGRVTLQALRAAGYDMRYDPSRLEISYLPDADQSRGGTIALGGVDRFRPEDYDDIALFSAFVNMRATQDFTGVATSEVKSVRNPYRISLDGAARIAGLFTLEGEGNYHEEDRFTREGTRIVYDDLPTATRWQIGDVNLTSMGLQGGSAILGLNMQREYGTLARGRTIRPQGRGRFRIERPSTVDIIINGQSRRQLQLQPGVYDIDDLSLRQGQNNVQLIVEDEDGRVETLNLSQFFDGQLLSQDAQEFGISAGIRSQADGNDYRYLADEGAGSAYYRTGVMDNLTLGANAQADVDVGQVGTEIITATPLGIFAIDAAVSNTWDDNNIGASFDLDYRLSDIVFGDWDAEDRSFDFSIEANTPDFASIGDLTTDSSWMRLDANMRQSFGPRATIGFGAGYDFRRDNEKDRYSLTSSLSYALAPGASLSTQVGYESAQSVNDDSPNLFAFLGFSYRLGDGGRLATQYRTEDNVASISYGNSYFGDGVGSVDFSTDAERSDDDSNASASLGYTANRFYIEAEQSADFTTDFGRMTNDRTSLRLDTAFVFADGAFGFTRPVSDSFAIISSHSSLEGRPVLVEQAATGTGSDADIFFPAVINDLSSYADRTIAYDVADLPLGYDLGAGNFIVKPGYKSGYNLVAGSDFSVTVIGKLLDADGEVVSLSAGQAVLADDPDAVTVTVFTNRTGRFVAQGLKPGVWNVSIAGAVYEISIPKEANGLVKIGEMRPVGA